LTKEALHLLNWLDCGTVECLRMMVLKINGKEPPYYFEMRLNIQNMSGKFRD